MKHFRKLRLIVGFKANIPTKLPEGYVQDSISVIDNYFIQVIYLNGENEICFRQAEGNEDISGDYNDYKEIKTYAVDSNSIILKGNDGLYSLAIWKDDTFSYAVQVDIAISETDLYSIIESIK